MIVEEGARSSPTLAIKLLTLSTMTRLWVELVLYRKVVIQSLTQLRKFAVCMLPDTATQFSLTRLDTDELKREFNNCSSTRRRCSYIRYLWVLPTMKRRHIEVLLPLVIQMPNLVHLAVDTCAADRVYPAIDALAPDCPPKWRIRRLSMIQSRNSDDALSSNALDLFLPRLTHLHVVSPGPAFYERFDGTPERGILPPIEHLALDITSSYVDNLHFRMPEDMTPLKTIKGGELVPSAMGTKSSEVREVFVRAGQDVPDDCLRQLKEQAQDDPRVSVVRAPKVLRPSNQRIFDTLESWQKKVYRALEDVAEHWNKLSLRSTPQSARQSEQACKFCIMLTKHSGLKTFFRMHKIAAVAQ